MVRSLSSSPASLPPPGEKTGNWLGSGAGFPPAQHSSRSAGKTSSRPFSDPSLLCLEQRVWEVGLVPQRGVSAGAPA